MRRMIEEIRFLLACARLLRTEEEKIKIRTCLKQNLDWNFLLNRSVKHHLAPLLYYNLGEAKVKVKHIPPKALSRLEFQYKKHLYTNLKLRQEFSIIQERLKRVNIKSILIRGLALVKRLYHNAALRPMVDIDLLINKENLSRFEDAIRCLGYEKANSIQEESFLKKWGSNLVFTKTSKLSQKILLEVHWAFIPPRPYKIQPFFWDRLTSISINGCNVRVLSIEDSLIGFALHLRNHTRSLKLKHIIDIAEWLRNYQDQLDWKYIVSSVKEQRIVSILCVALLAANLMLQVPIPLEAQTSLPLFSLKSRIISKIVDPYRFLKSSNQTYASNLQGVFLRLLLFEHIYEIFTYPVMLRILRGLKLAK